MSLTPTEFQQKLIDHGFSLNPYGADGEWGPTTEGATADWFASGLDLDATPAPRPPASGPIPDEWLPDCDMTYVTVHWTAGAHNVSVEDKEFYHFVVDGNGRVVRGDYSIKANVSTNDADGYAAHTNQANTKNIGIAAACMAGATESPFDPGKYPLKETQWVVLAQMAAQLAIKYKIVVDRNHVLQHGEWQSNNNVAQKGKWDITKLPWNPKLTKTQVCDEFRHIVKGYM